MLRWIMDISSVSWQERASIMANFEISLEKKYQCEACVRTTQESLRNGPKGCKGFKKDVFIIIALNGTPEFKANTCIGNLFDSEVFFWMKAFTFFKKGIMPFEGTLLDQPSKVIDMFGVIEALECEQIEKENRKKEKEASRGR